MSVEMLDTVAQGDAVAPRPLVPSQRQQAAGGEIARERNAAEPARLAGTAPERRRRHPVAATLHYFAAFSVIFELRSTQRLAVLLFTLTDCIENLAGGAVGLLVFGTQQELHLSPQALLLIVSAQGTLSTLASPVMGYCGDRMRRRPLLIGGAALQGVACTVAGSGGVLLLICGLSLMNLGGGLAGVLSGIRYSIMSDYYPPASRARIFTVQQTGGNIGTLVGPVVGGAMADGIGWRPGFAICGGMLLFSLLAYLPLREPSRGEAERVAAGLPAEAAAGQQAQPRLPEMLRAVWAVRTLRRMYLAFPVVVLGGGALYSLNLYRMQTSFHVSVSALGLLGTMGAALAMATRLVMAPLVDRFTRIAPEYNMALVGSMTFLTGLLFAAMMLANQVWLVMPLFVVMTGAGAAMGPAQSVLPSLVVPPRVRSFGLSLLPVWGLPCTLVAVPLITLLYNQYGLFGAMAVTLPLFLGGALMYWTAQPLIRHDMRAAQAAAVAEAETRAQQRAILVCRDVDVTYSGVQVLFGVDFDVAEGEIVALLGTNGAGKSTLLRAIGGLTEASNGAVFFDGRDITHMPPQAIARTGVVMVLGGRAIFPNLTVEENLQAATCTTASDRQFVDTQMHRVLDEFFPPLRRRLRERAGTLSGGEQQMLALGQAFLMKPRLLMIDELSLGLAPAVVEQLLTILRAIHAAGTTIILVEQSVNLALTVADRAVFMEKGAVQFVGPTAELLRRPDVMRSVFLGNAAQGSLDATVTGRRPAPGDAEPAARPVVLEARDLRCRFGGVEALRGVSLTVHAAEVVGIIGANGAGKTTLFDALSGFVPLLAGTVRVGGQDATLLGPDARARLGLTRSFQDARLFAALTVRESILLAMERHGAVRSAAMGALWLPQVRRSEARLRRRADSLIEVLGLQRYADWFVGELSTGTRRIADIACTMAAEPDVLLLDEPSSGVAQAEVQELGPLLRRLRAETGCAMLVIEHDMSLIASVSDRLVAMELGTVMSEGCPEDVLSDARVVASYLGTSKEAIARTAAMPV
jgi:ABC-type branched-subunit amino acid transport system ATPase component/predicted MFS family arabinose efflux permease